MTIKALAGTAATLYLAAMPIVAQAEDNEGEALKLEPITVSGEKTDSQASPKTTPFATQYNEITEEQIKEQGSKDFLNTMRNVPGVMFQSKNLMGSQTSHSLYVRGRGASHPSSDLTIEFDGAPRFGAIYGQTLSDGIAVPTIGGMDIYKSPQPWRFGSGYAMISVDPKYMKEEGQAAELSASGGSHGTFLQSVAGGMKQGGYDIYASQSWSSTDGHRDHSRAQQQNYYMNAGAAINEHWDVRLLVNHVDSQTVAPWPDITTSGVTQPGAERFDTVTDFTTLTLNHRYDRSEGYLKAYYNDTDFDLLNELTNGVRSGKSSYQDIKMYGIRGRESIQPWQGGEIVLGMDIDETDLKNTQRTAATGAESVWNFPETTMVSPYFAVSHMFGDAEAFHMTPSAGARYYDHSEFGTKAAPQAGLVIGHGGTDLNMSYARGVNYPSVVALQGLVQSGNSSLWSSLKPEVVDHYEIGVSHKWEDKAQFNASVFEDVGKDRFRTQMWYSGSPVFNSTGKYTIRGLELSSTVSVTPEVEIFGGATWLDVKAKGDNGLEQDAMPYTPEFSFQAGLNWDFLPSSRLTLDMQHMQGLYQGTTYRTSGNIAALSESDRLGDITLVNMRVSHKFDYEPLHIQGAEMFASVDNLFDEKYEYAKGYSMPGTTGMVGFTIKCN